MNFPHTHSLDDDLQNNREYPQAKQELLAEKYLKYFVCAACCLPPGAVCCFCLACSLRTALLVDVLLLLLAGSACCWPALLAARLGCLLGQGQVALLACAAGQLPHAAACLDALYQVLA